LEDFDRRRGLSSDAIANQLEERFQKDVPEASVNIFPAPPIEGLGTAGGFKNIIQDPNDNGFLALQKVADDGVATGQSDANLQGLFSSFRADAPWLGLGVARAQATTPGVSIDDIRTTLESTLGPFYINDFNRFGRTWQVNVQALDAFRGSVEDVKHRKVRNKQNEMVPLAVFASVRSVSGPVMVMRYNMY